MLVWYQQVDNAKTAAEVVAIARDYLATWSPHENHALNALQRMTSFVVRAAIRIADLREARPMGAASPAAAPK